MARAAKKKEVLTPEEKLTSVLVPINEQEYQIPSNWSWIILGKLVGIKRGASPRPIKSYITEDENGINWIKIGDSDSGKYITHIKEKVTVDGAKKSVFVKKGTLLLSNSMSFGRPYILNVDGCIHDGWLAITPNEAVDKEYLYYALLASEWYFERVAVGTAVRNLNSDRVAATPIPLPPLPEQQRIVDRIESLFAKLDEAKEKAQAVVEGFEDRKAAILHKAFTGELTAEWRKDHGEDESNWRTIPFDEAAEIKSNLVDPAEYEDYPHIAPDNIEKKTGVLLEYHSIKEDGVKSGKHRFYAGQILYSKIRPYLSKVIVVDFDGLCSADMYPIEARGDTRFLWYYMLSNEFLDQASNSGSRSVLPKINQKELSRVLVKITSIDEQREVVKILDKAFKLEQQAKEAAEQVIDRIDTMKKSILARAFRGELGTNDPRDESAVELLKRVLSE